MKNVIGIFGIISAYYAGIITTMYPHAHDAGVFLPIGILSVLTSTICFAILVFWWE